MSILYKKRESSIYQQLLCLMYTTVDREIFTLKIICVKNFRVVKFSRFRSIHEILTIDDYNMDERLKISYRLVCYQVSGEPRIAGCT